MQTEPNSILESRLYSHKKGSFRVHGVVHHLGIAYWSTTEAGFCVCIMSFFKSNDGTKLIKNYWKIDKVRVLLRRGANVNAKNERGDTALILASTRGYLEVVRALLNHDGVDVNIQGRYGDTALIGATRNGHSHVVCDLLNHKRGGCEFQDLLWRNNSSHRGMLLGPVGSGSCFIESPRGGCEYQE